MGGRERDIKIKSTVYTLKSQSAAEINYHIDFKILFPIFKLFAFNSYLAAAFDFTSLSSLVIIQAVLFSFINISVFLISSKNIITRTLV
jgi:hypothetical protein